MNCLVCKSGIMRPSTDSYFARINGAYEVKYRIRLENELIDFNEGNNYPTNGKTYLDYVIIENVPCYKCEQCGEIVFSASVMEKIDDMLEHLEKIASKIFIVDYAGAA